MTTLSQEAVKQEEELIRQAASQLSDKERKLYFSLVKKQIKDPDTYAVLNWFFIAGLHHFYLGKWIAGAIDLTIFLVGAVFIFVGLEWVGVLMIVGISVFELYALFRSQIIVQDYNNQVMKEAIREVQHKGSMQELY
ncbi:MAG: TM2 domain-containing protein [Methylococcaceae bacterium]|nr:TM2 domain-containing protein [Methylococcaceae bacterium]